MGTVAKLVQGSPDHDSSCASPDMDGTFATNVPGSETAPGYCAWTRPAIGERSAPERDASSVFAEEDATGSWTLILTDEDLGPFSQDQLVDWELQFDCAPLVSTQPTPGSPLVQWAEVLGLCMLALAAGWARTRSSNVVRE